MSLFATWLRAEMAARGYDQRQLAQVLGVGESTVHGWLMQGSIPTLRTTLLLARTFQLSTDVIIRAAGYDVLPSSDETVRAERRAALLAALPRFAEIAEKIARLPAETQDAYLSIIERMVPNGGP